MNGNVSDLLPARHVSTTKHVEPLTDMSWERHLKLEEVTLLSAAEWSPATNDWNFVRISGGLGYLISASVVRDVSTDECVALSNSARAQFRASLIGDMRLQFFAIHIEMLSGLLTLSEYHALEELLRQTSSAVRLFAADHPLSREFRRICETNADPHALAQRFERLLLFSKAFSAELALLTVNQRALGAPERFTKLMSQLPVSELSTCSLPELAKRCRCSSRHLNRLFKAHFGVSGREKQTELRLERARRLLTESNEKIVQIALECGYQHLSLFNTMFKRRFNMTPSQWRQTAKQRIPARSARSGIDVMNENAESAPAVLCNSLCASHGNSLSQLA